MPRRLGRFYAPVNDRDAIAETAKGLEDLRIRLVAIQTQARGDMQSELMTAMRDAAARRPAIFRQHVQAAQVFHQAITQSRVHLQEVFAGGACRHNE